MKCHHAVLLALALLVSGCVKSTTKTTLNADASGAVVYEASYSLEAVAQAKERIEEMRARMEENGQDPAQMDETVSRLKQFTDGFEAEKITADLKDRGYDVKDVKAVEKEGWKGVIVEASFKDINTIVQKAKEKRDAERAQREQAAGGGDEGGGRRRRGAGMMMRGMRGMNVETAPMSVVTFQKTSDEKIGKGVLMMPRPAPQAGRAGRGGDGGGRGGRGGMGGQMPGMEDMRQTLRITLPGKIVEAGHCKKEDEKTIVLDVRGTDLQPDEDGNLPPLATEGAWVTFEIPEGCKIQFEEGAKKPEEKKAEEPAEGEKKEKKGGVKIQ